MKRFLAIAVALCAALLGSYYLVGTRVEPLVSDYFAKAAAENPTLAITPKSAEKGLFSSRYVYTLDMAVPEDRPAGSKPTRLVLDAAVDVAHGPFPFASGQASLAQAVVATTFALNPASDQDVKDFFAKFPELMATKCVTRVAFGGDCETRLTVPGFSRTVSAGGQPLDVDWQGMTIDATHDSALTRVQSSAKAPLLLMKDGQASMAMRNMTLESKASLATKLIWAGEHKLRIDAAEYKAAGQAQGGALAGLALDASLTPKGEVADYSLALGGNLETGAGKAQPFRLRMQLSAIDLAALNDLVALLQSKRALAAGSPPLGEPELRAIGNAMLPRSPSAGLEFGFFEGEDAFSFSCEVRPEGMPAIPATAEQALPLLRAKADLSGKLDVIVRTVCTVAASDKKAGVDQAQCAQELFAQAVQFVAMGLATVDGGRIASSAAWDGKVLTVNGRSLN